MSRPDKILRCAVYTRKSSEEGLEQDFNSLDAQREACEAFIRSQRHEGWQLLDTHYDDGGISGGTMQRPALQRLLDDIQAGLVDIIVVYKVDRLTRSLADFARMVELFDNRQVSFVSVTQQFNTTSSMGRLTLNVLLSFAQFEREVTGERIRDKIRASKAKGMFMGGRVPLGYRVEDRKLLIDEDEARTVRDIFQRYLELGSVVALRDDLNQRGVRGRPANFAGSADGLGAVMTHGAVYQLLRNPVYIGKIRHKGTIHQGQHPPLLDQDLWNQVQITLDNRRNGPTHNRPQRKTDDSPLIGKVVDDNGQHLTPAHTVKNGKRYRYYISWNLKSRADDKGWRLPASVLEEAVCNGIREFSQYPAAISAQLQSAGVSLHLLTSTVEELRTAIKAATPHQLLRDVVQSVHLSNTALDLTIDAAALISGTSNALSGPILMTHKLDLVVKRRSVGTRLVFRTQQPLPTSLDATLVRTVARAKVWFDDLLNGKVTSIQALAEREGVSKSYAGDVIRLAFLAPEIVEAITTGTQPSGLVADHLLKALDMPLDWPAQKQHFGFA